MSRPADNEPAVFVLKPGEHLVIPAGFLFGYACAGGAGDDNDCFIKIREGVETHSTDPQLMIRSQFIFTGMSR
jgi:hypothetical protein